MEHYIYLTTNLINGKKYIGKHFGAICDSYLGSGTLLQRAIAKYGKENFKKEINKLNANIKELGETILEVLDEISKIQMEIADLKLLL